MDKFLKLIPPCNLGLHKSVHFTQWIFLLSPRCPQKNLRIRDSISCHSVNGSLKQIIVYVGRAWVIDLIKISLLAWDKSLASQPCNFFHICCLMCVKFSFLFPPTREGRPKYFSYCYTTITPIISLIMVCLSAVVDLLKKSVVFVLLICCPEARSYLTIISNKVWHSLSLAL